MRGAGGVEATLERVELGVGFLDVDGDGEVGDGAAAQRGAHRVVDQRRDGNRNVDHRVVGGDVLEHPVEVDLLLEERAQEGGALHAGDGQYRGVVELGVVQAVEQVQAARSRRRQAHPQPPSGLGVARGHERGGFLVLHEDEADPVLVAAQPLHDPVDAIAGDPEDGVDPPVDEPLNEQLGRDLLHDLSPRKGDEVPSPRASLRLRPTVALAASAPSSQIVVAVIAAPPSSFYQQLCLTLCPLVCIVKHDII